MENPHYNSLTNSLIQNGIIQSESFEENNDLNIFNIQIDEDLNNSPFIQQPIDSKKEIIPKPTKRLNQSDLEMVSDSTAENSINSALKIIECFLNIKQNLASKGSLNFFENFLFAFFPRLYKAKLAKDAMLKLKELNIDTQKLLDKTIPYGEGELRYQNLIKYISYANEIQTKIKKETT